MKQDFLNSTGDGKAEKQIFRYGKGCVADKNVTKCSLFEKEIAILVLFWG